MHIHTLTHSTYFLFLLVEDGAGAGLPLLVEDAAGGGLPLLVEGALGAGLPLLVEGALGGGLPLLVDGAGGGGLPLLVDGAGGAGLPLLVDGVVGGGLPLLVDGAVGAEASEDAEDVPGSLPPSIFLTFDLNLYVTMLTRFQCIYSTCSHVHIIKHCQLIIILCEIPSKFQR